MYFIQSRDLESYAKLEGLYCIRLDSAPHIWQPRAGSLNPFKFVGITIFIGKDGRTDGGAEVDKVVLRI